MDPLLVATDALGGLRIQRRIVGSAGSNDPPVEDHLPYSVIGWSVRLARTFSLRATLRGPMPAARSVRTGPVRPRHDRRPSIAVVGAGITGLLAARQLAEGGEVTVLEQAERVGGQLDDVRVAGRSVDVGAEAVFTAAPGVLELVAELGLSDQLVPAASGTTWIWTGRGLRPLPEGFTPAGPTRLAPLVRSRVLPLRSKVRAALEPLIPSGDRNTDIAVGRYLDRRFGRAVTDRLVDPLLGALHAGDVRTLSLEAATPQLAALARNHRSLLLRRRPAPRSGAAFVTLSDGMSVLTERLATTGPKVEVRLRTRVTGVTRSAGRLRVLVDGEDDIEVDGVVLAIPARAAARLVAADSSSAAAELSTLRAASVAVTALAYPASAAHVPAIAHGTGILVPSGGTRLLKAATFLSSKWPHHADDEVVLIRASSGRADDDRAMGIDDTTLAERLHRELAEATGLDVEPLDARVRRWPTTMPQLEVGHRDRVAAVAAALDQDLPGVVVAGAPYHGPGLSSCVRSAALAAERVTTLLEESHP